MSALNKKLLKKPIEIEQKEEELTQYNNLTELSYKAKGLSVPQNLDWEVKNFLAQYDPSKGPIEKKVTKIVRVKEIDYNSPKKERKEFIYYYENWDGKDWTGAELPSVGDHVEGFYFEQQTSPVIERNRVVGQKRTGERKTYYIPYSKKTVDEIISKSVGTDRDTIIFVVKNDTFRNGQFTYSQFISNTFEGLLKLAMQPGGPMMSPSPEPEVEPEPESKV